MSLKDELSRLLIGTLETMRSRHVLDVELPDALKIDRTRDPSHGDLASNIAMVLSKQAGIAPRELAHSQD